LEIIAVDLVKTAGARPSRWGRFDFSWPARKMASREDLVSGAAMRQLLLLVFHPRCSPPGGTCPPDPWDFSLLHLETAGASGWASPANLPFARLQSALRVASPQSPILRWSTFKSISPPAQARGPPEKSTFDRTSGLLTTNCPVLRTTAVQVFVAPRHTGTSGHVLQCASRL